MTLTYNSVDELQGALAEQDYIAERGLAVAIYLALKTGKPLFLEGDAGVGKTEIAKVLAALLEHRIDTHAVLRGPGCKHSRIRVELRRSNLALASNGARRPGARGDGARIVLAAILAQATAAASH